MKATDIAALVTALTGFAGLAWTIWKGISVQQKRILQNQSGPIDHQQYFESIITTQADQLERLNVRYEHLSDQYDALTDEVESLRVELNRLRRR
jgi:chaperonin cofactor prefoldin